MSSSPKRGLVWWVIPGVLGGMPMPFLHPERRLAGGGQANAFRDELAELHAGGVRAVVSLLNIPSDAPVFESAGFSYLSLPVPDGGAPTFEQTDRFIHFVAEHRQAGHPVAVHCEAGRGRTGTLLAAYLISQGENARSAVARIRSSEPNAIETRPQIQFLEQYEQRVRTRAREE